MTLIQPTRQFVHVAERDDVAYLTLDRPPLNVLTIAMMRELVDALDDVGRRPALRALVLRGAGRAYSAGVDVGEHQGETLRPLLNVFHTLVLRLLGSPVPVVSVVHGLALGGGCELAIASDLLLVAEDARIGVPEIKLGVFPPAAAVLLPRLIGRQRTMELILTGEPISGAEAARIGLANHAVPADRLDETLEQQLDQLRRLSASSIRLARRAVIESLDRSLVAALEHLETFQLETLIPSHDAQEGLRAFVEKRPPAWQHR